MKEQRRRFLKGCCLALNGGLVGVGVSLVKHTQGSTLGGITPPTESDPMLLDTIYQRAEGASRRTLQSRLADVVTEGD